MLGASRRQRSPVRQCQETPLCHLPEPAVAAAKLQQAEAAQAEQAEAAQAEQAKAGQAKQAGGLPCATRLLPVLIGSGGTLSPPWSEQPKI
jgi:hypothetical protein